MTTPPATTNAIDLQGLGQLRRRAARDDPAALAEVAVQFDAMFIGMMLDSARSANLGGGILDSPQTKQYLELMDRQVALDMARHGGLGFGKLLLQQLTPRSAGGAAAGAIPSSSSAAPSQQVTTAAPDSSAPPVDAVPSVTANSPLTSTLLPDAAPPDSVSNGVTAASDPTAFIAKLLPEAKQAAAALGVEPRLLLAQAALETGWGKSVPQLANGSSANNLFGMKAGAAWDGERTSQWTVENRGDVAEARREDFRAYPSSAASLADYVSLIRSTPRYAQALASSGDPEAYARAVQAAGYATDPAYAEKWLAIYRGARLDGALRSVDGAGPPDTLAAAADVASPDTAL